MKPIIPRRFERRVAVIQREIAHCTELVAKARSRSTPSGIRVDLLRSLPPLLAKLNRDLDAAIACLHYAAYRHWLDSVRSP